jgi:anti-sigma regulatory factor (Ser/Thr protein kinase)
MASFQEDPSRNRLGAHGARTAAVDSLVVLLPHDPRAPALARRSLDRVDTACQLDDEDRALLALIASELVTNAIVYGTEPVALTVSGQHGEVTVEVADGDPRLDSVRIRDVGVPMRGGRPGGRGLRLVAAIADEWGVRPERSGKTVWARKTYDV